MSIEGDPARYLSGQYLADLLTWYHLSWTGETVRRKEEAVVRLMTRGENFTPRRPHGACSSSSAR